MTDKLEPAFCNKCGFCGTPDDALGNHKMPKTGELCPYLAVQTARQPAPDVVDLLYIAGKPIADEIARLKSAGDLTERDARKLKRFQRSYDSLETAVCALQARNDAALARELEALIAEATPGDLSTAEDHKEGGYVECPMCCGEGEVEQDGHYINFDGVALGVQFYGIGKHFGAHERLWSWLMKNRQTILSALRTQPTDNALVDDIVRDVAELPDRTSPDDWPEAMLVTSEELHAILTNHLSALRTHSASPTPRGEVE